MRFLLLAALPVLLTLVWNVLDCNLSLFFYDKLTAGDDVSKVDYFNGKTVWLTGASSGIGAALVCQLMQAGAGHVILSARRKEKMEQVVAQCQQQAAARDSTILQTKTSIVPYDAEDVEATENTVQQALVVATNHSIDIVILNAGIYQLQPALQTARQERDRLIRVNWQAPVDLSTALIQQGQWKERGHGHIIVVASLMATVPHGLSSTYAASKAALKSYFHTLSTEDYSWLRVQVACPGGTATNMWASMTDTNTNNGDKSQVPDRGTMTPERVAQLIVTGASGPYWLFYETWIGLFPQVLWVWLAHATPTLSHAGVHIMSHVRRALWAKYQLDVLDTTVLIQSMIKMMLGWDI